MSRSPLAGTTILVTRPLERSERLVNQLDQRGARAIVAPTIALRPVRSAALTAALRDLAAAEFVWLILTSPATVGMLADRLGGPRDVRASVAAVGDGTAEAFRRWARRDPDLRPRTFTVAALADKGWSPQRVDAYRTRFPSALPAAARKALDRGEVDAITFTSASTVRGFVGAGGVVRSPTRVVCIGPITAKEARGRGLRVHAVADPHTTDGLVIALERALTRRRSH